MLTLTELTDLLDAHWESRVLSVYANPRGSDPAARHEWRQRLDHQLAAARRAIEDAPHAEREAFARAAERLAAELPALDALPGTGGWVAFVTATGVQHAEVLHGDVPPMVLWRQGPAIAPYLCMDGCRHPVLVVVASSVSTRLYRCEAGKLTALPSVQVPGRDREPSRMGSVPQPGFHPGTLGETAADASQRRRQSKQRRLAAATAERLAVLAGHGDWIVLGGSPEAVSAVRHALSGTLADHAIGVPSLTGLASDAELFRAAVEGAAILQGMHDLVTVDELLEHYGADERAAVGPELTHRALGAGAVHQLLVTRPFVERHPDAAEEAVRAAVQQGGSVHALVGAAADRLDHEGQGIGARLRFVPGARAATPVAV